MFEQSLLTSPSSEKRAGAMAVSLTVELVAIGVVAIVPLLYTERLMFTAPALPIFIQRFSERPISKTASQKTAHPSRKPGLFIPLIEIRAGNSRMPSQPSVDGPDDLVGLLDPGSTLGGTGSMPLVTALPPPPPPADPKEEAHVTIPPMAPTLVPSDLQAAKIIRRVLPVYPPMARQMRTQGVVALTGIIGKDGTVAQLTVTSGHPFLVKAALDAVRQWTYQPTVLNGRAVEVVTTILVNFALSQ